MVSGLFGVAIVVVPAHSHHSVGKVERLIQTLYHTYAFIGETVGSEAVPSIKLALTFMSRNITPSSGSSIDPITALTGRPSIVSSLRQSTVNYPSDNEYDIGEYSFRRRMMEVQEAHHVITEYDARHTVSMCLNRKLQLGSFTSFGENELVYIWIGRKKRWQGTFRVIFDTGRTVLVGNIGSIFKHPKSWTRLRAREPKIVSPMYLADREPSSSSSADPLSRPKKPSVDSHTTEIQSKSRILSQLDHIIPAKVRQSRSKK